MNFGRFTYGQIRRPIGTRYTMCYKLCLCEIKVLSINIVSKNKFHCTVVFPIIKKEA